MKKYPVRAYGFAMFLEKQPFVKVEWCNPEKKETKDDKGKVFAYAEISEAYLNANNTRHKIVWDKLFATFWKFREPALEVVSKQPIDRASYREYKKSIDQGKPNNKPHKKRVSHQPQPSVLIEENQGARVYSPRGKRNPSA